MAAVVPWSTAAARTKRYRPTSEIRDGFIVARIRMTRAHGSS